jgi:hypothetical protein
MPLSLALFRLHKAMIPKPSVSVVYFIGRVFPDVGLTIPSIPKLSIGMPNGEAVPIEITLNSSELRV